MRRFYLTVLPLVVAAAVYCGSAAPPPGVLETDATVAVDTAGVIRYLRGIDLDAHRDPALYLRLGALYRDQGTIGGRLRSQQVLERALRRYPDDPHVLLELGRTYFAQTFYPDAIRCFNDALALDPNLCDARYHLGLTYYDRWRRVNEYTDDLATARWELKSAVECDPANRDAAVRYARALYLLGEDSLAAQCCADIVRRFPDCADGYLLGGVIHYEADRFDEAQKDFLRGLEHLDGDTRAVYDDMALVLSFADRDSYDVAPAAAHEGLQRGYWLDIDPDPTTQINERWLEHIARVYLADVRFSCARPDRRGWETDRGKTFIKLGRPLAIDYSLSGNWHDGHRETWTYVLDGTFHTFNFVDEFLNGNLRVPNIHSREWSFVGHASKTTNHAPRFRPVPGIAEVVTFRDDAFSSTFYLTVSAGADSLLPAARGRSGESLVLRGAFFDDEWRAEKRFADTLSTRALERVRRGDSRMVEMVKTVHMPFDRYHVAVAITNESGDAAAILRAEGDARRYAGAALAVSDIFLERAPDTPGAVVHRDGRTLHANTGRHYEAGEALRPYLEIYDLDLRGGQSDYQLTISIFESEEEAPAWRRWVNRAGEVAGVGDRRDPSISQTFNRSGTRHVETEALIINVDTLPGGNYEIVVDVLDRVSGDAARTRTTFSLRN